LSFWATNIWKRKEIERILKVSSVLTSRDVPVRLRKLKLIRDFFCGEDYYKIVMNIERMKLGNIGYFTAVQKGYGKRRQGFGEWAGKVSGIGTKIKMMNTTCTSIELSYLSEPKRLGEELKQLVQGFSLDWPEKNSESDLWLTKHGKIIKGDGEAEGIPIYITSEMDVNFVDEISNFRWAWEVTDTKIRLLAELSQDVHITILSENFSQSDWDPSAPVSNSIIESWSSGLPMSLTEIEEEISSCVKYNWSSILQSIKKDELYSKNSWDIKKMMGVIKMFLVGKESEENQDEQTDILESIDVDEIMDYMNGSVDSGSEISFSSDEEINEDDLFIMDMEDEDSLFISLEIFENGPYENLVESRSKWGMPKHNMVFSDLETLCRIHYHRSFNDVYRMFLEQDNVYVEGVLGLVLSFLTKRVCIPRQQNQVDYDVADAESDLVSYISSMRSLDDMKSMNEETIKANILFWESSLETAPMMSKPMIRDNISKLNRVLHFRYREDEPEDLENFKVVDLVQKIHETCPERVWPRNIHGLETPLLLTVTRSLMRINLTDRVNRDILTPYEQSLFNEAIDKSNLTTYFMDLFHATFGLSLTAGGYSTAGEDHLNV
jgi:hypothetical protein